MLAQVTGGVGREVSKTVQSAAGTIRGEDVPIYKVPLLRRFYGDADSPGAQVGQFYANVDRLNEIETTAKLMRSDGQAAQAKAFLKERPEAYYIAMGNVAERQVQKLRREKRALIDKEASREAIQRKDAQIVAVMGRLNRSMDRLKGR